MEIHTNFMPGDVVWRMENNQPVQRKITCTRISAYFEKERFVVSVHHSFDDEHKFFAPEQSVVRTKEQLKEKIFG